MRHRILAGTLGPKLYVLVGVNVATAHVSHVSIHLTRDDADEAVAATGRGDGDLRWEITRRDVGGPGYADASII